MKLWQLLLVCFASLLTVRRVVFLRINKRLNSASFVQNCVPKQFVLKNQLGLKMSLSNTALCYFTKSNQKNKYKCHWCGRHVWYGSIFFQSHLRNNHKKNITKLKKYFEINFIENFADCKKCKDRIQNNLLYLLDHQITKHEIFINFDRNKCGLKEVKLFINIQRKIMRSVLGLIVEEGFSSNILKSENMKNIFKFCETYFNTNLENIESEIETTLQLSANCMRKDFSNDLHCRLLSIKIDTDINASPNTFCLSTYFIEKGKMETRILGIIDLKDEEGLNEEYIKNVLYKFNIDTTQIVTAFCDRSKQYYKQQVDNCEYFKEIQNLKSDTTIFLGDVKIEPYLGSSAQMCLLNIFENSNIFQPFLECRNLVKYVSDVTNGYYEIFEANNVSLPRLDSPFIPGSTCEMMNNLLKAHDFLQNVKIETPDKIEDRFVCNQKLWSFIEAFCLSTNLLQKTILIYRDQELPIGDFYAQWLKCKLSTDLLSSKHCRSDDFISVILAEISKSIDNITSELLSKECVAMCLYLDPRFQRILRPNQKSLAVECLKKLWCRAKLYSSEDVKPNMPRNQLFDSDEDAVLNEFLSPDFQLTDKKSNEVFEKIEGLKLEFKMLDTSIVSFWSGLKENEPEVYTLGNICFAITATEVFYKTRYSYICEGYYSSDLFAYSREDIMNLQLNAHMFNTVIKYPAESEKKSETDSDTDSNSDEVSDNEATSDGPSTSKTAKYWDVLKSPSATQYP